MKQSLVLPVPNSVFFITGSDKRDMPTIQRYSTVWSTSSCVAVGCIPDVDGDTRITIGRGDEVDRGNTPIFDGLLDTKARVVRLEIVPGEVILQHAVPEIRTRVRIWVNHATTPDDVVIGLD